MKRALKETRPPARPPVEYVQLDQETRWSYLKRYYEVASAFYGAKDRVVSDEEVRRRIASFKERPAPRVRRRLSMEKWSFTLDDGDEGVRAGYFGEDYREEGWQEVTLPPEQGGAPQLRQHQPRDGRVGQ